jgi:hypothetical protein
MDYLGQIATSHDPPALTLQRWLEVIARHPNLALEPPSQGLNPFTKQPYLFQPPRGNACVILDGVQIGSMTWAEDGSCRIAVVGESPSVKEIAMQVANELGCVYEPN